MYLRTESDQTIAGLLEDLDSRSSLRTMTLSPGEVHVDVPGRVLSLRTTEIPLTATGLKALGDGLDIPNAFLLRQDPEFQQVILEGLMERRADASTYAYSDDGLHEVRNPRVEVISPARLVEVAARVIDENAPVRDFWSDAAQFRLDVYVPSDFDRGVGGDRKVGDLSLAGVRITQDRKKNLAPGAQPFQYRLVCTNGMTTRHDGLRVDARGQSVEEILAEFESIADLAFRQAEKDIESLYNLRSQPVDNPERTLLRMATDAGLPNRTITTLLERVPGLLDESDRVSTFDLVNLMTNQANDPAQRRPGYRLSLEEAAGAVVSEHAERCGHCQARLVHA